MSQRDYVCHVCKKTIFAGSEYIAYVLVSLEHRLIVEKEHMFCEPPDPWKDRDWDDAPSDIPDIFPMNEGSQTKLAA